MSTDKTMKTLTGNPLVQSRMKALREKRPFSLEPAGMIKGVTFVNDSAATTLRSVIESLDHFQEPVVWITEANDPGLPYEDYSEILQDKVKAVVVYGEFTARWHEKLWKDLGFFIKAETREETIEFSMMTAKANDTVIYSPGCRATDPFSDFKERGAYFNRLLNIKSDKT